MVRRNAFFAVILTIVTILLGISKNSYPQAQWTPNGVGICTDTNIQENPQIISDNAGGAIMTWQDKRAGSYSDIYAQRVDANGAVLWTANGVAICTAVNSQHSTQLVSDGSGGAIITWSDYRAGSHYDIYAQRVDANGTVLWTANGVAICTANYNQQYPQLVSDGIGGAIITWQDRRTGSYDDIYAQRVDANGNVLWTANGVAMCTAVYYQQYPKLVSDGSGGAIITWQDDRARAGSYDIYAQRVGANGNVLWTANGVAICTVNYQEKPQLVSDGSGGAIITWSDYRAGSYDIYAQRVDANGTVLWSANGVAICNAVNTQRSPQLVGDGSGGAIITWQDSRAGSYDDIYAQRVDANGNVLWTANGVAICTAVYYQQNTQIVGDGSGGAIITWQDSRGGSYDIYAQRVHDQGMVTVPNGGELWAGGISQIIKWFVRSDFPADHVSLLYSTDGGNSYPNEITGSTPNNGFFNWMAPTLNSITIRLKAQTKNSNNIVLAQDESDANFTIDSTPPNAFNLLTPANGVWTTASPTLTWQASSDALAGLLKYQLWIDGAVNQDSIHVTKTSAVPASPLSEGFHTWNIKALDRAKNERNSSQTWTVRVDSTAPTAFSLLTPDDGIWTNNTQPTFTWQASSDAGSGLNKYQLFVDGTLRRDNIPPTTTSTTPSSALSSADHVWYIVAVDNVNNSKKSNESRVIRIDNIPPNTFNLVSPTSNSWTGSTTPTFTWQPATDAGSGLSKYELWVDGVVKIDSIPGNNTSATLDASKALANGNHTWYVKAYDITKNVRQSSSTWTLRVDTIPPANFSLLSPSDSGFANIPTPNFSWSAATDAGAGISHYQLWIDGGLNLDNITTTTSSPATPLNEGPHSWFVKAVDKVANTRQSDQTWTVFGEWNSPRPFDLAAPANGAKVPVSQPVLSWHPSSDAGSGILKYQLWIAGLLNRDNISPRDTFATPVAPLPNGTYSWFVKAFDRALNATSSTSTWQFVVDRDITPPVSSITSPVSGQAIGSTSYSITGTADDGTGTGVKIVHVSVDGGATWHEAQATASNFSAWKWLWTGYAQGSYTIKSRATDVEGNVETPKPGITVTVDLTKPTVRNIVVTPNPTSSGTVDISVEFQVGNSGLNFSAIPSVNFTPQGGSAIPFVQTSYSGKIWRGSVTIAASEKNGTAIVAVSGAMDNLGNVMDPNPTAGSFLIDTQPPQAFNLISPPDSGWVNTRRPTFQWGAASDTLAGIGKYQLWIDGLITRDNISASATSITLNQDLSLGEHSWLVKALDKANNSRNSSSTWRFNMDFQAPTCKITAPADRDTVGGTSYSVRGTASDGTGQGISGVEKVELSVNNGAWQTAVNTGTDFSSWSWEWTGYSTGSYTLRCRAIDRAGNIGAASTPITVYINQSRPKVKSIAVAPDPVKAGTVQITINFEANDRGMNNSVAPVVTFTAIRSQTKVPVNQTSYGGSTWVGTATITADMNNGAASIQVSGAKDNYGNVMEPNNNAGGFTIDTVAPLVQTVKVSPIPAKAGNVNVTITFVESTAGLNTLISPLVTFTPASGTIETFIQTGYNAIEKTWSGTAIITQAMKDGIATIQVKGAEDLAGNRMAEINNAGSFLIDVTPPVAFELAAPQDSEWVNNSRPLLQWNPSSDATSGLLKYQLVINDNLNIDNLSPAKTSTHTASSLTDGAFLWYVMAFDTALNSTKSTSTWLLRIDTAPPVSAITNLNSGMSVSADTVVIEGTANDGTGTSIGCGVDSVFISFDGGSIWSPTISTGFAFSTWKYNWTGFTNQSYTIKSKAIDKLGNKEIPGSGVVITQVEEKSNNLIPKEFALLQNYPNPFNPETMISYQIPRLCHVTIKVYNTIGQEIKKIMDNDMDAGYHQILWDGKDNLGRNVGTGIYLYQLIAGDYVNVKKMIMLK